MLTFIIGLPGCSFLYEGILELILNKNLTYSKENRTFNWPFNYSSITAWNYKHISYVITRKCKEYSCLFIFLCTPEMYKKREDLMLTNIRVQKYYKNFLPSYKTNSLILTSLYVDKYTCLSQFTSSRTDWSLHKE